MGKTKTKAETKTIRANVDATLKAEVEKILETLGLKAGDAIRLFYSEVAAQRKLPFPAHIPNAETRKGLREADEGKNLTHYESFDDFKKAMMGD